MTMRAINKKYLREFIPAMFGYVVAVLLSITLLLTQDLPTSLKVPLALLPIVPMGFVMRAILRNLKRVDELQQRIQTQAIGVACTLVGMATFALGFLQNARVLSSPPWVMLWVLPAMIGAWGWQRRSFRAGIAVSRFRPLQPMRPRRRRYP